MLLPFLSEDFWNHEAAGSKKAQNKSSKGFNVVASEDLDHETNSKRMVRHPEAAVQDRTRKHPTRVYASISR